MRSVQRSIIATGVGFAAVIAMLPGAVAAKAPRPQLAPAAPTLTTPITVTWRVKPAKRGVRYVARLSVQAAPGTVFTCFSYAEAALRPTRRGYTGTFRPVADPALYDSTTQWCPGSALVTVIRVRRGEPAPGHPGPYGDLAGARVPIVLGPGQQQPPKRPDPAVKMTVLAGSTITASAPGRPDRSSPVTGTFRGWTPTNSQPFTDWPMTFTTGGIVPAAFPADPLCPGTAPPVSFDLAAASTETLFASGDTRITLVLNGAPSQLFGCGPAGPLSGTTAIPLSGKFVNGLGYPLPLTGSVSGIPLPGGSTGGLAANLTVTVNFDGSGASPSCIWTTTSRCAHAE